MATESIFESFLADQGYALFENLGAGAFRPIGKSPHWCDQFWDTDNASGNTVRLADESPFLGNFLVDAEGLWNSKRKGAVNSGVWTESGSHGRETPLEAWALMLEGKQVLIVRNLEETYAERQQLFQTARNSLLMHERLVREIQKKEILLHCIIHDLSQPLNSMRSCFNMLSLEPLSGDVKRMIETGQRESHRQEEMIRGILEAFSGELAAEQTAGADAANAPDLAACAKDAVRDFLPAFTEKGIRLQLDPRLELSRDWKVAGDAPRLARIFGNLLENAMRYSPKGTTVTIGMEEKGTFVLAYVDDEGPGLPKDEPTDRLFALFSKGKDRPGKAGLGLYFCKMTVDRWSGRIGAENRSTGGSRFWFRIPRAVKTSQSRAAGKQSAAVPPRENVTAVAAAAPLRFGKVESPLRILVVDDNDVNLELVIELLKKRGHSVAGARDGQEALDALAKDHFDVVLMDEQMPGMDGLEATRAIRQAEKTSGRHQMIVGVTGNVGQDEQKRRADAGMDAFLAKPYDMNALFEKVETISRGTDPATPAQVSSAPATPDSDEDVATHLQRTTGGNDKLIRSLAKSFLADTPKRLAGIRRALAKKDPETLARTAHALKGSLGIFGAQKAVAAARSLEAMGRASNLRGAQKEFRALETEFSRLKRDLLALQSATKKPRAASRPRRKK